MTANRVASLLIGPALVVASTLAPMLALGGQREGYRQQPDAAGCPGEPAEFYPCAQEKVRTFEPSRTPAGHPDLRGFWHHGRQNRIITDHPPTPGIRGETSIIVDPPNGEIPYQAWAEAKRAEVFELNQNPPSAEYIDPPARCISRGVPRQMYNSPPPKQFLQSPDYFIVVHEQNHAYQIVPLDGRSHAGSEIKLWMGDSRGRWEGDTLVVETTNHNGRQWLDVRANFYSEAARVTERFTLIDPDVILYEVTMEDPTVYTQPWKIAMPYRRDTREDLEIMEFACHEGNLSPALQLGELEAEGSGS